MGWDWGVRKVDLFFAFRDADGFFVPIFASPSQLRYHFKLPTPQICWSSLRGPPASTLPIWSREEWREGVVEGRVSGCPATPPP